MKKTLLTLFTVALAANIQAQVSEPTLTQVWKYNYLTNSGAMPTNRFATAHNGTIYAQEGKALYSWNETSAKVEVVADATLDGYAITCDQVGNVVYSTNKWAAGATAWAFIDKDGVVTTFTLTLPNGITASSTQTPSRIIGDITTEKGGYMYVGNWNSTSAVMFHMKNMGTANATVESSLSSAFAIPYNGSDKAFDTNFNVQPMLDNVEDIANANKPSNMLYTRYRSNKHIYYLNETETEYHAAPEGSYTTMGFDVFELSDGIKYGIYPLGTTYDSSFAIVDLSNGEIVAKTSNDDDIVVAQGNGNYFNTLLAEKVSSTKVNIYQCLMNTQVAMYTFEIPEGLTTNVEETMIDANAPVEYYNLQGVKVENPANGLFIKRQGTKATKVVL